MKFVVYIGILLAAIAWYKRDQNQSSHLRREYQRGIAKGEDYCTDKRLCALVYVAPWCPSCKSLAPRFKAALEKAKTSKEVGFKIVVGQGKPSENDAEAAAYGFGAVTDPDNILHTVLGVNQYPSFYVLDKDGAVVLKDQEAVQWVAERFLQ